MHPNSGEVARTANDGNESVFDRLKHIDEHGECWYARELMPVMGYTNWRQFGEVIERAKLAAANTGDDVNRLFEVILKKSSGGRPAEDYRLTRHAAYLAALNGDPRKPEVAAAQAYFAVRTHQAELAQTEHDGLPDWARQQIATIRQLGRIEVEQKLQGERLTAVECRVDGLQSHHDWFTALGYAKRKGLPTGTGYLRNLGKLAANICRREGITPEKAQDTRYGGVNSYPVAVLDEASAELAKAA